MATNNIIFQNNKDIAYVLITTCVNGDWKHIIINASVACLGGEVINYISMRIIGFNNPRGWWGVWVHAYQQS